MDAELEKRIQRAKELLKVCRHIAMATVNADGSPHNSPLLFMHDAGLEHVYWASSLDAMHSQNVLRTGQVFLVLYEAAAKGGLYMRGVDAHALEGEELAAALVAHNEIRTREGNTPLDADYYTGESPRRMWGARITNFWVNTAERDEQGRVVKDGRIEITREDLLG